MPSAPCSLPIKRRPTWGSVGFFDTDGQLAIAELEEAVPAASAQAKEPTIDDPVWARRDPDLILLHDDPEFDRLYPEKPASPPAPGSH